MAHHLLAIHTERASAHARVLEMQKKAEIEEIKKQNESELRLMAD